MNCPRCTVTMDAFEMSAPDGASGMVYRCTPPGKECGVWYDGTEHAVLHARLDEPGVRDALIHATRVGREAGRPEPTCPRCADQGNARTLAQVSFVGLTLDLCESCLGLWIDRSEIPALLNALPLFEATEGGEVRITHYRQPVLASEMHPNRVARTRCVRCQQLVALDQSVVTDRGLMCVLCADAYERHEPAAASGSSRSVQAGRTALWGHVRSALAHLFG